MARWIAAFILSRCQKSLWDEAKNAAADVWLQETALQNLNDLPREAQKSSGLLSTDIRGRRLYASSLARYLCLFKFPPVPLRIDWSCDVTKQGMPLQFPRGCWRRPTTSIRTPTHPKRQSLAEMLHEEKESCFPDKTPGCRWGMALPSLPPFRAAEAWYHHKRRAGLWSA